MNKVKSFLTSLVRWASSNDTVLRAWHTFYQGFLGVFLVGIPLVLALVHISGGHVEGLDLAVKAFISLVTGSVMAGIAAVRVRFMQQFQAAKSALVARVKQ